MIFLCDTNVAYHGGTSEIQKSDIIQSEGDTLAISPISSLELITKDWHISKKKACQWLIDNIDDNGWFDTHDCYLSKLIKIYDTKQPDITAMVFKALVGIYAKSNSEEEFNAQANLFVRGIELKKRRGCVETDVSLDDLKDIRNIYSDFVRDIESHLKKLFPNYRRDRTSKQGEIKTILSKETGHAKCELLEKLVIAIYDNNYVDENFQNFVVLSENGEYKFCSENAGRFGKSAMNLLLTTKKVDVFLDVAIQYFTKLTSQTIHVDKTGNDFGDIVLLYHIDESCTLVTYENRWADIMVNLGYSHLVKKCKVPQKGDEHSDG